LPELANRASDPRASVITRWEQVEEAAGPGSAHPARMHDGQVDGSVRSTAGLRRLGIAEALELTSGEHVPETVRGAAALVTTTRARACPAGPPADRCALTDDRRHPS
jgi:porphobilinogen deaminase